MFQDLVISLDRLTPSKDDLIYVLATSSTLNENILFTASRMNHMTVHRSILPGTHVDTRDGFPYHFFRARYAVVAEPLQYEVNPDDHRALGLLVDQILHRKDIGASYEKLPDEFILDNGVKVSIYENKFRVKRDDIENLVDVFYGYYPDLKTKFRPVQPLYEIYDEWPKDRIQPKGVTYADKVRLLDMTFIKRPQNRLEISYYWQIIGELGGYISLVHFTDDNNRILFQNDHAIGPNRAYEGLIGEFVKETYFLEVPPSAENKEVYVKMGLYSPDRGDRLRIASSGEMPTDDAETRAIVGKIEFKP